ncbi:isotrichodermin C-15 hydroxylase [Diaporthe helianthi]|uniref:Isotrichodermin C-15 hydroxylase n=1 Tax=Diaporthe helianthi TaxID=158607 RepID=A0A2P5HUN7_DIAHE|nr:isotrichodermin C-15 hydroxylase [Diaporthe helianthi]
MGLVFITPKASEDIFDSHTKHLKHFTRTGWLDLDEGEHGINWERDPAKEPTLHKHVDYFLERMRELGNKENDVDLPEVWAVDFFLSVNAITKKFRLLAPLTFLFVLPSLLATHPPSNTGTEPQRGQLVVDRINRRGNTSHLDYFEHLCPPHAPEPGKKRLKHMEIVAGQFLSAGYEPVSSQFLCTLMFLIQDSPSYQQLISEIRDLFNSPHEIETESVAHLRVGIVVQYGHFAFTRSPWYFRDLESFKPQRWAQPGDRLASLSPDLLPGEGVVFDPDFRSYAMWDKPKIRPRFRPSSKDI